jgi:hypothetical protein
MEKKKRSLLNEFCKLVMHLTQEEADSMERHGKATRISRNAYRLVVKVAPSTSPSSPSGLTKGDIEALVGARPMSPERKERIDMWRPRLNPKSA